MRWIDYLLTVKIIMRRKSLTNVSSYDLLVLHKNVYRVVVKEILPNNYLDYNGVRIMH